MTEWGTAIMSDSAPYGDKCPVGGEFVAFFTTDYHILTCPLATLTYKERVAIRDERRRPQ